MCCSIFLTNPFLFAPAVIGFVRRSAILSWVLIYVACIEYQIINKKPCSESLCHIIHWIIIFSDTLPFMLVVRFCDKKILARFEVEGMLLIPKDSLTCADSDCNPVADARLNAIGKNLYIYLCTHPPLLDNVTRMLINHTDLYSVLSYPKPSSDQTLPLHSKLFNKSEISPSIPIKSI